MPWHRTCWLCHAEAPPMDWKTAAPEAKAGPPIVYPRHADFQFNLASLLMMMTLAAVIGGVSRMAPGLGLLLVILTLPALVRTWILVVRENRLGHEVSALGRVRQFLGSLGLMFLVLIVGLSALFIALLAICAVVLLGMR
jgi:hypothetical protein